MLIWLLRRTVEPLLTTLVILNAWSLIRRHLPLSCIFLIRGLHVSTNTYIFTIAIGGLQTGVVLEKEVVVIERRQVDVPGVVRLPEFEPALGRQFLLLLFIDNDISGVLEIGSV